MPENLLIEALQEHFDLSQNLEITVAEGGFLTENKFISDPDSGITYFLKQHRTEVAKEIDYVEKVEEFFSAGGIPVIMPIRALDGRSHFTIEDRLFTLYPCVEGIIHDRRNLSVEVVNALALNLACMHLLSKDGIPPELNREAKDYWSAEKFATKTAKIRKAIADKEKDSGLDDFDDLTLKILSLKEGIIATTAIPYESLGQADDTVTHGDYHERNVFFDDEGRIKYVFDFEKSLIGPRAIELARSLLYICFDGGLFTDRGFELGSEYLKSYRSLYPIENAAIRTALQAHYMKTVHSTWTEGEHYLLNNTRTDVFLEGYLRMIQYFRNNFEEFCSKLNI